MKHVCKTKAVHFISWRTCVNRMWGQFDSRRDENPPDEPRKIDKYRYRRKKKKRKELLEWKKRETLQVLVPISCRSFVPVLEEKTRNPKRVAQNARKQFVMNIVQLYVFVARKSFLINQWEMSPRNGFSNPLIISLCCGDFGWLSPKVFLLWVITLRWSSISYWYPSRRLLSFAGTSKWEWRWIS